MVYLGDVITANNIPIENASLYWNQALSPTRARNTPWASVFGNHDDASFEWPLEWFSATGIPPVNCYVKISGELKTVMVKLFTVELHTKDLFSYNIFNTAEKKRNCDTLINYYGVPYSFHR